MLCVLERVRVDDAVCVSLVVSVLEGVEDTDKDNVTLVVTERESVVVTDDVLVAVRVVDVVGEDVVVNEPLVGVRVFVNVPDVDHVPVVVTDVDDVSVAVSVVESDIVGDRETLREREKMVRVVEDDAVKDIVCETVRDMLLLAVSETVMLTLTVADTVRLVDGDGLAAVCDPVVCDSERLLVSLNVPVAVVEIDREYVLVSEAEKDEVRLLVKVSVALVTVDIDVVNVSEFVVVLEKEIELLRVEETLPDAVCGREEVEVLV